MTRPHLTHCKYHELYFFVFENLLLLIFFKCTQNYVRLVTMLVVFELILLSAN